MNRVVIIDADPIVYRAGFAAESFEWHVITETPEGDIVSHQFRNLPPAENEDKGKTATKQLREYESSLPPGSTILECQKYIIPEPIDHPLATVKAILEDCIYQASELFEVHPSELTLRILLSGPGNFRNDLATVRGYKANRKDDHKPYWYQQIRNYLTDEWHAEVIEGREADDECSIIQHANSFNGIICTIDKDLDQVPGWHYDYWKKTRYYTTEEQGHLLFYKQALSGDATDNIPGCYQVGFDTADRIIDSVFVEYGLDHGKIWEKIVQTYADSLEKYGEKCEYYKLASERGVEAVAIEMARLVKMQEYLGQLWTPPGQPDETLELGFEE